MGDFGFQGEIFGSLLDADLIEIARGASQGQITWATLQSQTAGVSASEVGALFHLPASIQSGTAYTVAPTDAFSTIVLTNASAVTVTIPLFAASEFADGDKIELFAAGAGGVTLSVSSISLFGSAPTLSVAQNGKLYLECVDASTDTWAVLASGVSVAGSSPNFDIGNMTVDAAEFVVAAGITNLQDLVERFDHSLVKTTGTGIAVSFVVDATTGGTTFDVSALHGQIRSDQGFFHITYAGTTGVTIANLNATSTYVYIDNSGNLQQQTTVPTRVDWARKLFVMRVSVNTSTNVVQGFEYLSNPLGNDTNHIRDIYRFLLALGVPFKIGQEITGRAADLGFDCAAGELLEFGGTGDINNANVRTKDLVTGATFAIMTRDAVESTGETALPKTWDSAGTVTALGSTTWVAHRLFRFSTGNFVLQRGQGNYANLDLAKSGSLLESYVLNPQLVNSTFFGYWFIESTATNTQQTALTEFRENTLGVQGGSSSALAGALLKGNSLNDLLDTAAARANIGTLVQQASAPTGDATVLWFDTDAVAASPSVPPTTESATTYTLAVSDINSYKIMTAAALVTVTIPLFANVEFADGDMVGIFAAGAGGVTVSVTGLSLIGSSPNLTIPQNKSLLLTCADASADTWIIAGGQTA
jgi:hypothetical protein